MNNRFFRTFAISLTFFGFFLSQPCLAQGTEPGTIKWTYPVDEGCATPAIGHNGTIYVPSGHHLLAINPNGTLKWSFDTGLSDAYVGIPSNYVGIPSVDSNDNIYFVVSGAIPSYLYALDSNKNLLWVKELYINLLGGYSASCGEVAIGPDSTIYASGSNKIQAFTPTGQQKWIAQAGELAPAISQSGNIFTIDWIYYSRVYELNPANGLISHSSSEVIGASHPMSPVMGTNGDIYILGGYMVSAFSMNGTKLWDFQHGDNQAGNLVTGLSGISYFYTILSADQGRRYILHAINSSGIQEWSWDSNRLDPANIAVGNDGTIYLTPYGVTALNPNSRSVIWQTGFPAIYTLGSYPVIGADGTLYINGTDAQDGKKYLYAFSTSSTGPANSSWPMYGANAQHTRVVNSQSNSSSPWEEPPGQLSESGTGCETPQTGRNAVVITHGWNSDATAWVNDMAKSICSQVGGTATEPTPNQPTKLCTGTRWDVWTVDWRDKAAPLPELPKQAWKNATSVGDALATTLQPCAYQHVHFIAHSAGSNVIDTATRAMGGATTIHETFLDAYDPSARSYAKVTGVNVTGNCPSQGYCDFNKDFSTYGELADWADNYVDTRQLLLAASEPFDYTKLHMRAAYNIDVTPESDDCGVVNFICIHAWPYQYYQSTIGALASSFGFPLSREAGQPLWAQGSMQDQYPRGAGVHIDTPGWQSPPKKIKTSYVPMSGGTGLVIDQFGVAQCIFGVFTIPCSQIQLTSSASPSAARLQSQSRSTAAATAPTHAPAWIVMQVQTTEPINTLRFNWRFAVGGEGLLRVFVKGNPDREIDQRHVPAVSSEPESIYLDDLEPGTYKIAFRLDGYGTNPSGVELTGIELGWKTLKVSR